MKRVIAALGAALLLAGCGTAQHNATPRATVTVTAPSSSAPVPAATPSLTTVEKVAAWNTGTGGTDFQAVRADISSIQSDAQAADLASVENDGGQLATDAKAAQRYPIPVDSHDYTRAMDLYANVGVLLAAGDISGAEVPLNEANALIVKCTDALKAVGSNAS